MPSWYSEPQHCWQKIVKFPNQLLSKRVCEKTSKQPIRKRKSVKLPKKEDKAGKMANASITFIEDIFAKK